MYICTNGGTLVINERIYFDSNDKSVYLEVFAQVDRRIAPRDAMLVIPGGGYEMVCMDSEGESVALAYLARGVNAFVVKYNVDANSVFPSQLLNVAGALKHIKENAEKYHINPNRIFAVGFSAGGHLTGLLATQHRLAERELGLPEDYLKIAGAVFSYPVITAFGETHENSFALLAKKPFSELTEDERRLYSIECNIKSDTPRAFIWHTAGDCGVAPYGSLKLAMAYYAAKVPVELHLYPNGPHGSALCLPHTTRGYPTLEIPDASEWLDLSVKWMSKNM